jgi:hypothetical protein
MAGTEDGRDEDVPLKDKNEKTRLARPHSRSHTGSESNPLKEYTRKGVLEESSVSESSLIGVDRSGGAGGGQEVNRCRHGTWEEGDVSCADVCPRPASFFNLPG